MASNQITADVSVIMPAYNASSTIRRALLSIANQTLKPHQVVVVDDGSSDETFDIAKAMQKEMNGISLLVLQQENGGAGSARNNAIHHATATWLAFLDADDEWLNCKIAETFKKLDNLGPEYILISHDVIVREQDGEEQVFNCSRHNIDNDYDLMFHAMYRRGYISTSTAIAKRSDIMRVGCFDTSLRNAQDFDLWLKLVSTPKKAAYVFEGAYTRHHRQAGSIQTYTKRRLDCGLQIAIRYFPQLKKRQGNAWSSFIFRVLAIHAEAFATYRKNQQLFQFLAIIPTSTITLARFLFGRSLTKDKKA